MDPNQGQPSAADLHAEVNHLLDDLFGEHTETKEPEFPPVVFRPKEQYVARDLRIKPGEWRPSLGWRIYGFTIGLLSFYVVRVGLFLLGILLTILSFFGGKYWRYKTMAAYAAVAVGLALLGFWLAN